MIDLGSPVIYYIWIVLYLYEFDAVLWCIITGHSFCWEIVDFRYRMTDKEEDLHPHLQDEVIKKALASGLDLREYSKKVSKAEQIITGLGWGIEWVKKKPGFLELPISISYHGYMVNKNSSNSTYQESCRTWAAKINNTHNIQTQISKPLVLDTLDRKLFFFRLRPNLRRLNLPQSVITSQRAAILLHYTIRDKEYGIPVKWTSFFISST